MPKADKYGDMEREELRELLEDARTPESHVTFFQSRTTEQLRIILRSRDILHTIDSELEHGTSA